MQVRQIKWLPLLMSITITGIAAFQVYWLQKTYEREQHTLERSCNITFRETIHGLQAVKLKLDGMHGDSMTRAGTLALPGELHTDRSHGKHASNRTVGDLITALRQRINDSSTETIKSNKPRLGRRAQLLQFLYDVDSMQDTLTLAEIKAVAAQRM